ncbi:MAG: DUF1674 domain-containing protein [Gammaproteobacteria bacterium]|nr:DUF1674 domain-containing protein [Gammaproteobacteria bacterium]
MSQNPENTGRNDKVGDTQAQDSSASPVGPQVYKPASANGETSLPKEIGGREGPEPVRYGDWEKNGRCIDF